MSIAKRIRDARKGAGLSQEELAAACGVNQGTVSAWETGGSARIGPAYVVAIAKATGASVAWLRTGQDKPTTRYTVEPGQGPGLASRLYRLAAELAEIAGEVSAGEATVTEAEAARVVEAVEAVERAGPKGKARGSA